MFKNNLTPLQRTILVVLFFYPILLLSVKGGTNALFAILLVLSIVVWFRDSLWSKFIKDRPAIYFSLAMASPLLATLASQAYHGAFDSLHWDSPARFLLAVPIYYALKHSNLPIVSTLRYAFPLGAISSLLIVLYTQHQGLNEFGERASNTFLNPINFGNLALVLGISTACLMIPIRRPNFLDNALQLSGLIAGLVASALSGARGGWIAIPFVLIAWLLLNRPINVLKRLTIGLIVMAAIAVAGYFFADVVQQRARQTMMELASIMNGDFSTSFGQRIQLWMAGLYMFMANPIFGVGPSEFFSSIDKLQASGVIQALPKNLYGTEVHSYYIATMAKLGTLGLLSAFAIFLVPLAMFFGAVKSQIDTVRIPAMAGICFVISFSMFCLTVEMFNIRMVASFYSLTIAALLAAASPSAKY